MHFRMEPLYLNMIVYKNVCEYLFENFKKLPVFDVIWRSYRQDYLSANICLYVCEWFYLNNKIRFKKYLLHLQCRL